MGELFIIHVKGVKMLFKDMKPGQVFRDSAIEHKKVYIYLGGELCMCIVDYMFQDCWQKFIFNVDYPSNLIPMEQNNGNWYDIEEECGEFFTVLKNPA